MNFNEECIFLRKKLIKRPLAGKATQEIQSGYVCMHKNNYMTEKGCPSKNICEGFKITRIRIIYFPKND